MGKTQSPTAKGPKVAEEKKSYTAEDASAAKEEKSITAKVTKDAERFNLTPHTGRKDNAKGVTGDVHEVTNSFVNPGRLPRGHVNRRRGYALHFKRRREPTSYGFRGHCTGNR